MGKERAQKENGNLNKGRFQVAVLFLASPLEPAKLRLKQSDCGDVGK